MVFTPGKKNLPLVFSTLFDILLERITNPLKGKYILDYQPRLEIHADSLMGFLAGAARLLHDSNHVYEKSALKTFGLRSFYATSVPLNEGATLERVTLTRHSSHGGRVPIGPNVTLEDTLKSLNP